MTERPQNQDVDAARRPAIVARAAKQGDDAEEPQAHSRLRYHQSIAIRAAK